MTNIVLNSGSGGATLATETITAVDYQKIKLIDATAASTAATGVAANPLQVSIANTGANATAVKVDGSAVTQPVSGTFWQATQPVSAASLPLPSGAATAAKQPALGTAGTPSADVITVQGAALMTALKVDGSAVTQPVSAASLPLPTGASTESTLSTLNGKVTACNTGAVVLTTSTAEIGNVKNSGTFATQAAQSGTWTVQPGNTANTTPWLTSEQAATSGGATPYKLISAATTNATSVKASAGQLYMITASNVGSGVAFLKIYNKASAPTVGTDTPVHVFLIPVASTAANGAGTNIPVPDCGLAFGTGIAFAITGAVADSDTTAVAANQVVVNLGYK